MVHRLVAERHVADDHIAVAGHHVDQDTVHGLVVACDADMDGGTFHAVVARDGEASVACQVVDIPTLVDVQDRSQAEHASQGVVDHEVDRLSRPCWQGAPQCRPFGGCACHQSSPLLFRRLCHDDGCDVGETICAHHGFCFSPSPLDAC